MTPSVGSPTLLLQLTTNLVHNAIVHNIPGRGRVWVHTTPGAHTSLLTVENTGELINAHQASTLTEPFQRGTERVHTGHPGVGLGLAIVNTITQAHDGTLTLTPAPPAASASPWSYRRALRVPEDEHRKNRARRRCRTQTAPTRPRGAG